MLRAAEACLADSQGLARKAGIVTHVSPTGTYGFIADQQTRRLVFLHQSQLSAVALRVGLEVSYLERMTPRGASAHDVRPA
jgi:cold shock CspA family protein